MSKLDEVLKAIPEFIEKLEKAKSEAAIAKACQQMKDTVDQIFNRFEVRRDPKSMARIREAVNQRFKVKELDKEEKAEFPYYYTASGHKRDKEKGIPNHRLEHLANKHLKDERNIKADKSSVEPTQETVEVKPIVEAVSSVKPAQKVVEVKPVIDVSLDFLGLSEEQLAAVNQAIGDADVKEWLKQAVLQRANAINALHERLSEDLSAVSSEELMIDKKYRTNASACRELTSRAVRAIKAFNAQSPEHRWCITNKLISELTGNTVKAIAKAVEGMDIDSYNQSMDLQPIHNRLTKAAIGDIKEAVSIKDVLGVDE